MLLHGTTRHEVELIYITSYLIMSDSTDPISTLKSLPRTTADRLLLNAPSTKQSNAINELLSMTKPNNNNTYKTPAGNKAYNHTNLNELSPIHSINNMHNDDNIVLLTPNAFQSPDNNNPQPKPSHTAIGHIQPTESNDIISPGLYY